MRSSPEDLRTCYELLPSVSRTFALNIRILPGELRPAVTVAYLLFRLADTFEDAPGLAPEERTAAFDAFLDRLDGAPRLALPEGATVRLRDRVPPAELRLVRDAERVFRSYEQLPGDTRAIIGSHVAETARGMERFARERTQSGLLRLETWKDLDEYCYYVAGTIGIMLTRLFATHRPRVARTDVRKLTALSTSFGRGLQLTNILKGVGPDRREGRVYLPAEALARHASGPSELLERESRTAVAAVVQEIIPKALQDLEDALRYTTLLPRREPRLRLFCLWPLFAAVRTLGVISDQPGVVDEHAQPKISRADLYREMALAIAHVGSNGRLRRRFERFRRDLFPARARREVWAGS
ncbi:MAG: phytoene/squalene synthase family protein [Gemmatimonadetes bacterium]|nr:phytoene/squalene synthase family protein [Gemmatimonadota bacterium]